MNRRRFLLQAILAGAGVAASAAAVAQGVPRTRAERPYRDDLMTDAERGDFQRDMRNARTDREREALRREQRDRADARAPIGTSQNVPPYRAPSGGWPGTPGAVTPAERPVIGNPPVIGLQAR
jgi:hypothetical protein